MRFSQVIRQMWVQDRSAAVPLLSRLLIGGAGLLAAAVAFLLFQVLPALAGISIDYQNARETLTDLIGSHE